LLLQDRQGIIEHFFFFNGFAKFPTSFSTLNVKIDTNFWRHCSPPCSVVPDEEAAVSPVEGAGALDEEPVTLAEEALQFTVRVDCD
jgi:hypothetical protein